MAGQCVSAIQMIVEESFLKKKNFHPLQVSSLLDKKIKIVYFIDDLHVLFLFFLRFLSGLLQVYYSLLIGCDPNLIVMPSISVEQWSVFSFSLYIPCKVNKK